MPGPRLHPRGCVSRCVLKNALEVGGRKFIASFPKVDHQDIVGRWGEGWHSCFLSRCFLSSAYFELHTCLFLSNRRELGSTDGVPQISLEDALSSQEVEVAYICSESSSHEDYIRQFLNAGKHVLVEYPMTLSWAAAKELWALAEQKGDVCSVHLEHRPSS
eukprot:bmy_19929T0